MVALNFSAVESFISLFDPKLSDDLFLASATNQRNQPPFRRNTRKEFLADMADNLLHSASWFRLPEMAQLTAHLADEKKIQFWFADETLQNIAQGKGWTGEFPLSQNGFF